ncbi:hypothetical protein [Halovivax cerinus]|uniref:Uncharacterized protein n=1 Tax=Halovivax cerinus TaxID=1487865 RepID=A0ABD5NT16_9EURY|nr:hypothetical protein [Halovivax cerinus]
MAVADSVVDTGDGTILLRIEELPDGLEHGQRLWFYFRRTRTPLPTSATP